MQDPSLSKCGARGWQKHGPELWCPILAKMPGPSLEKMWGRVWLNVVPKFGTHFELQVCIPPTLIVVHTNCGQIWAKKQAKPGEKTSHETEFTLCRPVVGPPMPTMSLLFLFSTLWGCKLTHGSWNLRPYLTLGYPMSSSIIHGTMKQP